MKTLITLILSFLGLTIMVGQTWIRQNPFPELSVIQDIHFDGLHGIAVGTENTILTTTNGGINWIPRTAPQAGSLFQTALIIPGTNGQVMYAGGYQLIVSLDGGLNWSQTNTFTQLVYKIQSLPDGSILVFDSDAGLISKDDGVSWETIPFPGTNTSAGHFTNEMNGWVVFGGFNDNQVWVTTDGGESWSLRDTLRHPVISEVWMLNDQTGFVGSRDFVYKTSNGGQSWVQLNSNPVNSITDMHVVSENEIWTCLNNGFIFYSLDGGVSWTEVNPNIISSNQTPGLFANESGKVWVAGKYVSIMYSDDYGTDWTDQIPSSKGIMYSPYFINEHIGIIGSSEGVVLKTINGGASFEKMQLGEDDYFFSAQMIDDQTMVVGSSSGKVYGSANQGQTWILIGEGLGQVTDIHAFNLQTAVVISEFGKIYRTENGGAQWDEVYSGNPDLLLGVEFVDAQRGWVCGWFGQILHTIDGGRNWFSQYRDGRTQFTDIHFTSADEGWAVSSSYTDSIWHTTNGGVEWQPLPLPYQTYWQTVSFSSQDTGWLAGGSAGYGLILRTNDGGLTWIFDHQSPEALFGLYAVPGKETAWATGLGGNIVKYSPCTFNISMTNLNGEQMPCQSDTVTYSVTSSGVDIFEWTFPSDWIVFGNPNTSSIQVIVGIVPGNVSVSGMDGCDNATAPLMLTTNPIGISVATISESDGVLTCDLDSGFYQWLRNGSPIPGAQGQTYMPVSTGFYEVVVTSFATGCEARSNGIDIMISAIGDFYEDSLMVYPNPVFGKLFFSLHNGNPLSSNAIITLIKPDGKVVLEERLMSNQLDISGLNQGFYILLIRENRKIYRHKIFVGKS